MDKDINIANRILDDFFPEASLMRTTQILSNRAVKEMGYDADYTEMVRYVEKVSNVIIESPLEDTRWPTVDDFDEPIVINYMSQDIPFREPMEDSSHLKVKKMGGS